MSGSGAPSGAPVLLLRVGGLVTGRHCGGGRHRPLGSAAEEAAGMWRRFTWLVTLMMAGTFFAPVLDQSWSIVRLFLCGGGLVCLSLFHAVERRCELARGGVS